LLVTVCGKPVQLGGGDCFASRTAEFGNSLVTIPLNSPALSLLSVESCAIRRQRRPAAAHQDGDKRDQNE
jgi:hypothetical protein